MLPLSRGRTRLSRRPLDVRDGPTARTAHNTVALAAQATGTAPAGRAWLADHAWHMPPRRSLRSLFARWWIDFAEQRSLRRQARRRKRRLDMGQWAALEYGSATAT
eukprot:365122-Chlamydomonas_euryale.AAC.1